MYYFQLFILYSSYLIFPFLLFLFVKYKKQKKKFYFQIFILFSLVFVYARFLEPNLINIVKTEIDLTENSNQEKIKIALISDMHIGIYKSGSTMKRVVEKINKEKVDVVFILGDILYKLEKEKIADELAEFQNFQAETYAITGNHDSGYPGIDCRDELNQVLNSLGIKVLDNKIHSVSLNGKLVHLLGLSDFWTDEADYELLDMLNENENVFVLAHNPDVIYSFENKKNIDLLLSGHTHGGQIRIPFLYKKVIPSEYGFDKGLYEVENAKVFVSPGLGMVGLPMRFLMPPEIDILYLYY